jgi:hypothetical protein
MGAVTLPGSSRLPVAALHPAEVSPGALGARVLAAGPRHLGEVLAALELLGERLGALQRLGLLLRRGLGGQLDEDLPRADALGLLVHEAVGLVVVLDVLLVRLAEGAQVLGARGRHLVGVHGGQEAREHDAGLVALLLEARAHLVIRDDGTALHHAEHLLRAQPAPQVLLVVRGRLPVVVAQHGRVGGVVELAVLLELGAVLEDFQDLLVRRAHAPLLGRLGEQLRVHHPLEHLLGQTELPGDRLGHRLALRAEVLDLVRVLATELQDGDVPAVDHGGGRGSGGSGLTGGEPVAARAELQGEHHRDRDDEEDRDDLPRLETVVHVAVTVFRD